MMGSLFASSDRKRLSGNIPLRELLSFLIGRQRRKVAALTLLSFINGLVEAATLALFAQLGTALVRGNNGVTVGFGFAHVHARVLDLIVVAGVLCMVRLVLQLPTSILPAKITADVQAALRVYLIGAFTRASWGEQSRDREGHLQDTMVTQVMQATSGALQATTFITTTVTFLALLLAAFALNPLAATLVALSSLLIFFMLKPFRSMGVRNARLVSRSQTQYAGAIAETIRMAEETHVFGVDRVQRERIGGFIRAARDSVFRFQLLAKLVANTYMSLIYLLMVGALAALYVAGKGHAGSFVAVLLLLVRAGANGQLMAATFQGILQSLPFVERIRSTAQRYQDSSLPEGSRRLTSIQSLGFERVSFAYRDGHPVLRDLSFEVNAGETIGIVGPSGAGKSTLVQLLLQLRVPQQGRYVVNGVPTLELASADWHRLVAYVPQEPRLLHTSVADNIRYFRPIDEGEVRRAARLARIEDDVLQWPQQYDTMVGPRADAVSGGQQQRICLARALAARPSMLVLDEPTSALDPRSETLIQESLAALKEELTLFIVAHRMSTLDVCDRVMVIIDGRLVAFDTRELLQEQNAYYRSASLIAAGAASGELP
jgi:ABC-type multidrug transport system fused ATPase/permease subunit